MAEETAAKLNNRPSFSVIEEGSLKLNNPDVKKVLYHQSLNVLLGFSSSSSREDGPQPGVVVLDIASGTLLHDTRPEKSTRAAGDFKCLSVPDRGALIVAREGLLGVRKDFGRALLLESILQPAVRNEEETVRLELPHNEAMLLRECLQTMDMQSAGGGDGELGAAQVQVVTLLTKHMKQYLFSVSKGSRMSSNWCIVSLSLPLKTLKSVCTQAILELRKNNRNIPALPIAASIVVRLASLLSKGQDQAELLDYHPAGSNNNFAGGSSNNPWGEPGSGSSGHHHHHHGASGSSTGPALHPMMSEAARRETFTGWPHMSYKWALPGPMAEAGFYHQPNTPESDRAVCFQCFLTLIAWESTDEPWSEHERHAATCPLVKGDYTCNVPLSVTMATQPALVAHPSRPDETEAETIACISNTSCPDLFATSTSAGSVALWNISGPLKKEVAFEMAELDQLTSSVDRVASLCVLSTGSSSNENGPSKCSIVVGAAMAVSESRDVTSPCLVVYDIIWKKSVGQVQPENYHRNPPSASSSTGGGTIMKKGGTTKKVSPAPHMLAATFNPGASELMMTSAGSSNHPGGGLFFSFGDDPLLEEDVNFGQMDANIEKLGKATGLLNKLMHNMSNSSFSSKNQQTTTTVTDSAASSRTGPPSKPPIKPAEVPDVKMSFVLNLSSFIGNSSGYLEVKSLTPTWDSSHLVAVLALPAPPVLNNDATTSLLTGDSAKEARLRSIWDGQNDNGPLFEGVCEVLLFKLDRGALNKNPVGRLTLSEGDGVECLVMLPNADQQLERQQLDEEESWASSSSASSTNPEEASGPMRAAVITKDGRLRLLIMKPEARDFVRLTWLDLDTPSSHKFISATYCSSVERICASTDKGELVFFKITTHSVPQSQLQSGSLMAGSTSSSGGRGVDGQSGSKGKSIPASAKLLIHQPITSSSLYQLHQLTLAERFPQSVAVAITAPSCWSELALTQRQRRQPVFHPGPGGFVYGSSSATSTNNNNPGGTSAGMGEDGLYGHMARVFRLQQDKFSWDDHFFEISLPPGAGSLAHVHLRFVLSPSCTVPPEIQVSLLEQRSRSLQWGRGSSLNLLGSTNSTTSSSSSNTGTSSSTVAEEVDNHINFNVGHPSPRCSIGSDSQGGPQVLNPVLMPEYLEAHDAVLLCGPYKLNQFMADSGTGSAAGSGSPGWNSSGGGGQTAVLTLGGHQLLQSTARNFMIHVKYIPSFTQAKSISLLNVSRPMTNASGGFGGGSSAMGGSQHQRRTNQTKGCDWIQEVAISVQRCKPTTVPQERTQRCSLLASSNSTGQLLEFAHKSKSRREHIMVLNILNWKTALHYAVPMIECRGIIISSAGDIAGHVVEIINRLRNLLDWFVIRGNRTTAQQTVQLIVSTHELAIQCVPEEDVLTMTKQLMFCLLQGLESLHTCSSSGVVHWYLVLLSRVYLGGESEVAGPVWGVLKKIITELQRRKEPLQQLLQSRYGFYGRPFESDSLFDLDQNDASPGPSSRTVNKNGSIAASFAALHQLVNGASSSAQQQQQQQQQQQSGDGQKDKTHSHLESLSLKRSLDLLDVEPIPFSLASASDGVRLERSSDSTAAASHSQFTAVALNGLVEASKLSSSRADGSTPAPLPHLPTSHRWHHLLGTNPPLLIVMERLHSGGRKFAVLDFGSSILLTDVYIPTCADWTSIAVDAWSQTDRGKTCETDLVRLASSSDINGRPLVLPDLQPPVVCRYIRLTVTGRQGLSSSSCRTSAGHYYGHTHLLPNDPLPIGSGTMEPLPVLTHEEIKEEIATLEVLADHSQCHYVLASDRLRCLLRPLLANHWSSLDDSATTSSGSLPGSSASHHIDHYLQSQLSISNNQSLSSTPAPVSEEDAKIMEAYDECLKLLRQQNLLRGALRRLHRCLMEQSKEEAEEDPDRPSSPAPISQASSPKLHWIAQGLVNVLLAATVKKQIRIERKTAQQLFSHLYITSQPSAQLSVAALLSQSDDTYKWMPEFVADTLKRTLSSDASTALIPKDRVFVTLLFMSYKSMQLSSGGGGVHLLDPILAVLNDLLSAALQSGATESSSSTYNPMALAHLDLSLVNWILLFCCCCLDRTFSSASPSGGNKDSSSSRSVQRWDFMQGESLLAKEGSASGSGEPKGGSGGSAASRIYRRKLQKKLMQTHYSGGAGSVGGAINMSSVSSGSGGVLSGSNKAKFILAHSKQVMQKNFGLDSSSMSGSSSSMLHQHQRRLANMDVDMDMDPNEDNRDGNGASFRAGPGGSGQPICSSSGAARVAKNLVSFLLVVGASGSGCAQHEETFLLTCKVLARLIAASQNGLRLGHITDEHQLTDLLRLASSSSLASGSDGQQWLSHSIYCLIVDYLNANTTPSSRTNDAGLMGRAGSSLRPVFATRYDHLLRSVGAREQPVSSSASSSSAGSKPTFSIPKISGKMPAPSTSSASTSSTSSMAKDMLAYETAKLAETQLKMDQHVDDLLELFDQPHVIGGESVPPVLKKAWPSISSVMKNLAESQQKSQMHQMSGSSGSGGLGGLAEELVIMGTPLSSIAASASSSLSSSSSGASWDLRDESRVDGPWKLKTDLLSDAFFEAVLQGLTSSFHDNKRRPLPEDVPGDPVEAPSLSDHQLLSAAFNNIFTRTKKGRKEVVSSLKLWVLLNSDNFGPSSASATYAQQVADALEPDLCLGGSSTMPEATVPSAIVLSAEAIRSVLESLARIPSMDVGDWTAVLRSLAWLSSPRWLLTERPDENAMDVESSPSGKSADEPVELADQMCAGPVISSPHLIRILYSLVSGQGLVPFSLGDKQLVGPSISSTLSDVLSCLKVWCNAALAGSQLGTRLRDSLFELFLELASTPHGPIARGAGPLDAQVCYVESLLKVNIAGLDPSLAIRVIQAIVSLNSIWLARNGAGLSCVSDGHGSISGTCGGGTSSGQLSEEDRVCFSGLHGPSLMTGSQHVNGQAGRAVSGVATPSALLTLSLQLAVRLATMEGVSDLILSTPSVMDEIFESLNHCTASSFGSSLGVEALGDAEFSLSRLHTVADHALQLLLRIHAHATEPRALFQRLIEFIRPSAPVSDSSGSSHDLSEPLLIFILHALKSVESVQLFHESGGFAEVCLALSRIPVRLFNAHSRLVSNVLSYVGQTAGSCAPPGSSFSRHRFAPRTAFPASAAAAAAAAASGLNYGYYNQAGSGAGTSASSAAAQHFMDAASLVPLAVYRRGGLRLDDEDEAGLLNLAPLSTITCSHPSAQPADVLLQPNPPHRRARSPSWSHHFYPAEQYIELTITLPCPVLVKEIQLHPHLTSLATCPSSVGVEMSPENSGQMYPVGAILSATGLTTIAFKLESPRVAALILLRLYKPRDSSNIGLAQIRILGSLALTSSTAPSGSLASPSQSQSGLSWLSIVHHCLTVADKEQQGSNSNLLNSLRTTAGRQNMLVEQCCGLLNAPGSASASKAGYDVIQMASDVLLDLGRHSAALSNRFVRLQLQDSPGGCSPSGSLLLGATPAVSNVLHELCVYENERDNASCSPDVVMDAEPDEQKEDPAGSSNSGQSLLLEWLHQTALWQSGSDLCGQEALTGQHSVSTCIVHCAAAVLWASPSVANQLDMDFAQALFDWTKIITTPELKVAIDYALCSVGRHRSDILGSILGSVCSSTGTSVLQRRSVMETLARACQSESGLQELLRSGLLRQVSNAISEFCLCVLERHETINPALLERTVTALDFWTLLCEDWGSGEGRNALASFLQGESLLQLLLQALCHRSAGSQSSATSTTAAGFSRIEDSAVSFFRQYCWAHKENSVHFAQNLLHVLKPIGSSSKLLTGFTRRLLLQLLLEPEKVYVYVTTAPGLSGVSFSGGPSVSSVSIGEPRHPAFGHGKKNRLLYVSSEMTCTELIRLLTEGTLSSMASSSIGKATPASKRAALLSSGTSSGVEDKRAKLAMMDGEQHLLQLRLLQAQLCKNLHYLTGMADQDPLPGSWTLSQMASHQRSRGSIEVRIHYGSHGTPAPPSTLSGADVNPLSTLLEEFAALGGLAVLSKHLPMLLSTSAGSSAVFEGSLKSSSGSAGSGQHHHATATLGPASMASHLNGVTAETIDSWVKLDGGSDDMDEEMDEILMPSVSNSAQHFPPPGVGGTPQYMNSKRSRAGQLTAGSAVGIHSLPLHSLAAFSLFLSMPLYAEAVLQDRRRAQMLLRLALGVSDDGQGGNILSSADAALFPILPFLLLQNVLEAHSLDTQEGADLRQQAVDKGVLQLLLACLAVFTQQVNSATVTIPALNVQFVVGSPSTQSAGTSASTTPVNKTETTDGSTAGAAVPKPSSHQQLQQQTQQQYWAKGTGFGTGSTAQTWDVDGAMHRQRAQEEQATCLLHTLAAYIHPSCPPVSFTNPILLPAELLGLVQSSHLIPAICSYLRNDSVMDMARHVPLYKALLLLLRSVAACPKLIPLLVPSSSDGGGGSNGSQSIYCLLRKLRNYVTSYTARLASVQNRVSGASAAAQVDDPSDSEEGIADLSKDICNTWTIVRSVVMDRTGSGEENMEDHNADSKTGDGTLSSSSGSSSGSSANPVPRSPDKLYCDVMQPLQFDSYGFLVESNATDSTASMGHSRFTVAYHFENAVRAAGERSHPNRMKRLAQEAATLTTSLPLSASSSVFVRCDTDRLDIMKVLITGPADTPYANGCFEFDVYFPPDYPQSPMQVHLATTGRHTVRFNPNLYNDGKVCLSVLNTWHGRPEEKWNSHTSSLLQVLVSIQSLILVSEPYFNEPGYERSRGTPSGNQNSRDYDVNIRQATVKWAMLEQIKNPAPCFKEVTQTHFWLKRKEIEKQCEDWITDMELQVEKDPNGSRAVSAGLTSLKRHYGQLKDELARLSPPASLAGLSIADLSDKPAEAKAMEVCEDDDEEEEEKALKISPLAGELYAAIAYDEDLEDEEDEVGEEEEDYEDAMNPGKEDGEEDEEEDELDELKEMIFAHADSEDQWKGDEEEDGDSDTELNNFPSNFKI